MGAAAEQSGSERAVQRAAREPNGGVQLEVAGTAIEFVADGLPKRLRLDSWSRDPLGFGRDPNQAIDPTAKSRVVV